MMMKSMAQMQSEMFAKAKWDGSYPKLVIMPLGILALAKNEEDFDKLMKSSNSLHMFFFAGMVLAVPLGCLLGWFIVR